MKLKLVFIPRYHCDPDDYRPNNPPFIPPLGISTLTTFIRKEGYSVEQDDLDIRTSYFNKQGDVDVQHPDYGKYDPEKINLKMFLDSKRVNNFFDTSKDEQYEEEAEKILKLTNFKGFDIVGFSLMPTDNPSTGGVALALAKMLKQKHDPLIIMGGSIDGEVESRLLEHNYIDCRVRGHPGSSLGEISLLNLLSKYERGVDLKKIKGINYFDKTRVEGDDVKDSWKYELNITKPTFEGLPMNLYKKKKFNPITGEKKEILVLPYFFIKGCPHNCAFCSHSTKNSWAAKSPEIIANELKEYVKKYKTKYFYFHNTTINPTYKYAEELTSALIKNDVGALWTDCANLNPLDKHLIKKFKEAGAVRFVFGFEGASQRVLDYIGKNFKVSHAIKMLKLCKKYDIWAELDMICGFPYEYESDIDKTISFVHKYKNYINACSLNKFWLEGRFFKFPQKYNIKLNLNNCESHINWSVRSFDEIEGLLWKDKLQQTQKCFDKLRNLLDKTFETAPDVHNLFFNQVIFKDLNKKETFFNNFKFNKFKNGT